MTEILMEERIAIRDSARPLKRYGSTGNNLKRQQEAYLRHIVVGTDTLQGLALKYGVTMEQIRRANRLWANDSLFLRKSLLIPIAGGEGGVTSPNDVVLLEPDQQHPPPIRNHNHNNNNIDDVNNDPSYNDFLVKIDCSIASTKSQVMMSQDNSQFVDNDSSLFVKRKSTAMSRLRQHQHQSHHQSEHQSPSSGSNPSNSTTEIPPVVMTQGRHVKNALQRLEREQYEMFEL